MKSYQISLRDGFDIPVEEVESRVNFLAATVESVGGKVYGYLYLASAINCTLPESEARFFRKYHDVVELPCPQ